MTPPPDLGLGPSCVYLYPLTPPTVACILLSYNKNPPCFFPPIEWAFLEDRKQILFIYRFPVPRKVPDNTVGTQ